MSDVSELAERDAATIKAVEQLCTVRVWLATLLTQTVQAEATIKYRIAELEHEAERLRTQLGQTTPAIEPLRQKIQSVDEAIRRRQQEVRTAIAAQSGHAAVEREKRLEDSKQAGRPVRRKDG